MTDKEFEKLLDDFVGEPVEKEQQTDPRFTERINGSTPNGGDYSIAYYYDENHTLCPKSNAKYCNIVEYNKNGDRINEAYGVLGE